MQAGPDLLRRVFLDAVEACHPRRVVPPVLPPRPRGRIVAIAAGKAAAAMAAAAEDTWGPFTGGFAVTRQGHEVQVRSIPVISAEHPFPDQAGAKAGRMAIECVRDLAPSDTVLVLLSGGGSALMAAPLAPLPLDEKRAITRSLVLSGAPIDEINCVRKHLSALKGGRLAAHAFPARVITVAISDVVGDQPSVIASGPTVADPTTRQDALDILQRRGIATSDVVKALLADACSETLKPGDPRLARADFLLSARGADLISAACDAAQRLGVNTQVLGVNLEGDARQVGLAHGEIARHIDPGERPLLLLSGGELTVTVRGSGQGGPNREYLLGVARALQGAPHVWALAGDSDGIDGSDHVAGGWIGPDMLARSASSRVDLRSAEDRNDSALVFRMLGQELITGPTRTNVNDLRAILVMPSQS